MRSRCSTAITINSPHSRLLQDVPEPKDWRPAFTNERYRWNLVMRTVIERPNGVAMRFGDLDVRSVTRHDRDEPTWHRGGPVGVNRCLGRLRAFYSWAVKADYVTATPFKKGTETIVEMFGEAKRERRLQPAHGEQQGEQERVFKAANALLTMRT